MSGREALYSDTNSEESRVRAAYHSDIEYVATWKKKRERERYKVNLKGT